MSNTSDKTFPRRNILIFHTPAEIAIYNAIDEVEKCGADTRLTEAVNLLSQAKKHLSDYLDEAIYERLKNTQ